MQEFVSDTGEERIAVVQVRSDESMNKNRSGMGEGGAEAVDVAQVKICRPGNVIDMRMERQSTVEDDIQTHNLWGGGDSGVINAY